MQRTYSFFLTLFILNAFPLYSTLKGQDRKADFEIDGKYTPLEFVASGEDCFYLICEEEVARNVLSKAFFKFDKNLKPVWKEPVVLKNQFSMLGGMMGMYAKVFSYSNPADHSCTDYIFRDDAVFRVMPDGTPSELDTQIPKKELKHIAAVFTDVNGLNIITLTGAKDFPSGTMNWYTYAHDTQVLNQRTISLPQPAGIDKKNESGWRLNEATDSGLYFYYVSYKNEVKDQSRPILTCHVIPVDLKGKAGEMIDLDLGLEKYTAMSVNFQQDEYSNLTVYEPPVFRTGVNGGGTWYHIPTDNAFMGIKIDANSNRIYTITAQNDDLKIDRDGTISGDAFGRAQVVKSLELATFDLQGNKVADLSIGHQASKLKMADNYDYMATVVEIHPLSAAEGVVIKLVNNGDGIVWSINSLGELVRETKIQPYAYREKTARYYYDIYAATYFTNRDFDGSPYALKEESPVVQCFDSLDEKIKRESHYLSLDDYELLAVWDKKERVMKLNAFDRD